MDTKEHYTKRKGKYYCKLCNNSKKLIAANVTVGRVRQPAIAALTTAIVFFTTEY